LLANGRRSGAGPAPITTPSSLPPYGRRKQPTGEADLRRRQPADLRRRQMAGEEKATTGEADPRPRGRKWGGQT
jgi:hypothetical protein